MVTVSEMRINDRRLVIEGIERALKYTEELRDEHGLFSIEYMRQNMYMGLVNRYLCVLEFMDDAEESKRQFLWEVADKMASFMVTGNFKILKGIVFDGDCLRIDDLPVYEDAKKHGVKFCMVEMATSVDIQRSYETKTKREFEESSDLGIFL